MSRKARPSGPFLIADGFMTDVSGKNTDMAPEGGPTVEQAINRLCAGEGLTEAMAEALFAEVVAGRMPEVQLAGLLVALKAKGETADELIGAARALRTAAEPFP